MRNKLIKLIGILRNRKYGFALLQGVAAGVEHERFLKSLRYNTVVDIGANRGQFALVAKVVNPRCKVHSFEPLGKPSKIFEKIFKRNDDVTLHNVAIGDESVHMNMHVSMRDDSSSLLPITGLQEEIFPGTREKGLESVKVVSLGEILDHTEIIEPALIKIDVQGFELRVLKGCESVLNYFNYVYVECSFMRLYRGQALAKDVIEYLRHKGFDLEGVYNISVDKSGVAVQGDFFFSRKKA